jgi:peroxiredoxin
MRKQFIIGMMVSQCLILIGLATTSYFTFTNKQVLVETEKKLANTFIFMDEMAALKTKSVEARKPLAVGSQAPEFALMDENEQQINLSDYKGKKTLLVFSSEGCDFCKNFYPVLNKFIAHSNDVQVVIMQLGSSPEKNKQYKKEIGINAPLLSATQSEMKNYKVKGTPTSVLIDKNGRVIGTENITQLPELLRFANKS